MPSPEEQEIQAPDGQWYLVRTSGAGVQRFNMFNMGPSTWTDLVWFLRRRKRWQVEVFQFDAFGVGYPPVLRERFDNVLDADGRADELAKSLGKGVVGWDRWHLPLNDTEATAAD